MAAIKKHVLTRWNINKMIKQNAAEILDVCEGCLLDDLYYITRRGYLLFFETYQNTNSSIYTMYFTTDSAAADAMWTRRLKSREEV